MKRYKLAKLLFILFISTTMYAINNPKFEFRKEKSIHKTYETSATPELSLTNKFGDIDIVSWEGSSIQIDINISVSANNEEKVNDMLNLISINFKEQKDVISAETLIGKKHKKSWWSRAGNINNSMEYKINYKVKIPVGTRLNIDNKFGNIYINTLDGPLNLTAKFGYFTIGTLNNTSNTIAVKFFEQSDITAIKNGTFNCSFSKINIDTANSLTLENSHCQFMVDTVSNLNFVSSFDTLIVNKTTQATGTGKHSKLIFRDISDKLTLNTNFGSLKIKEQQSQFNQIAITSNYTEVSLDFSPKISYQFNTSASYGTLKFPKKTIFTTEKETFNTKQKIGYYGNEKSTAKLSVSVGFGNLRINEL